MTFWQWLTITWDSIVNNSAAAWLITLATVIALLYQIKRNNMYNDQQYEMQRRVNAANILYQWSTNLTMEESISKRIVEQFSEEQVKILIKGEGLLKIKKNQYIKLKLIFKNIVNDNIQSIIDEIQKITDNGKIATMRIIKNEDKKDNIFNNRCSDCVNNELITLSKEEIILLRWYIMHYLNNLECVLLQCKSGIVDIDIMFEQLKYQYDTRDGVMALKKVRNIVGNDAYPAIEWFCIKLEEKLRSDILEKGVVNPKFSLKEKIIQLLEKE